MSPESTKAKICSERKRLGQKLLEALSALTALQSNQGANLIAGGDGLPNIKIAIQCARERWEKAKAAYAVHLRGHGC